nr:ATP-binding protein [uncultured Desulfobulbus sp.]
MLRQFSFGLSFKILTVLVFYISAISMMAFVSHDDLVTTEKKIGILEFSYGIHNIVLEARRFEKNYFLYGHKESLGENKRMLKEAMDLGQRILQSDKNLAVNPKLKELDREIKTYLQTINELEAMANTDDLSTTKIADTIRQQGKTISEISEQVVIFEKNQIHLMISLLRGQLISWSSMAICIGIVLAILIVYFIFKPLSVIKKATVDIAEGKFRKIEVINTRDEIQQVMEAFNIMVSELERRQDQLIQAEKLSSLGTLTAGVAHQLNNPLNNISTSCQIAIDEFDGGDGPFLKKMLNNIDQETLRARDVVKSLLEFSRAQEFCLRETQLSDVVKKAVLLAKSQVGPNINVSIDIPQDLVFYIDVQRMQEVFINLIINAAQAIERQGEIAITAAMDFDSKGVVIEVRDTGSGISDENQAKIFDPFFTTKEEGQGTGLGLSVVYGIIQKHEGTITVQSVPGQGTSFFIHLPVPGEKDHS